MGWPKRRLGPGATQRGCCLSHVRGRRPEQQLLCCKCAVVGTWSVGSAPDVPQRCGSGAAAGRACGCQSDGETPLRRSCLAAMRSASCALQGDCGAGMGTGAPTITDDGPPEVLAPSVTTVISSCRSLSPGPFHTVSSACRGRSAGTDQLLHASVWPLPASMRVQPNATNWLS